MNDSTTIVILGTFMVANRCHSSYAMYVPRVMPLVFAILANHEARDIAKKHQRNFFRDCTVPQNVHPSARFPKTAHRCWATIPQG
jgi:hypothetical protein